MEAADSRIRFVIVVTEFGNRAEMEVLGWSLLVPLNWYCYRYRYRHQKTFYVDVLEVISMSPDQVYPV